MDEHRVRLGTSLTPVRLSDKRTFDLAYSTLKQPISDTCFVCAFTWAEALRSTWTMLHDHVCVFANGADDLSLLHPPVGLPGASEVQFAAAVRESFEIMDAYNAPRLGVERSRIEYVSDELLERFSATRLGLSATPLWADYVYDTERLISLAGGDLKSKRHGRTRFLRENPDARTEVFEPRHLPGCLALLDKWSSHGDATHDGETNDAHVGTDVLRSKDHAATVRSLQHAQELGLLGMVVMVGDRLVGFTLGMPISPLQSMVLVEKTDRDFDGCPQFIFSEFCRTALGGNPECNAGDDWGIPSLRYTKQSWRPVRLLSKYVLARTTLPVQVPVPAADVPQVAPEVLTNLIPVTKAPLVDLTIREATPADRPAIAALEIECAESDKERFGPRQVRALISNPRAPVVVAESGGRIIGWAAGLIRKHRRWESGRVYAVAVARDARGRGIGRQLTVRLLDTFRTRGIQRVYLEVRKDNATALRLYETLGFTPVRRLPAYYGPGRDALRCRANLGPTTA